MAFNERYNQDGFRPTVETGKTIFVFETDRIGTHTSLSAREAVESHGATFRQAHGLQGNSFGIVTKELRKGFAPVSLKEVSINVERFIKFAKKHPTWIFNVCAIGCGLASFKAEEIAPLFNDAPDNVRLPNEFNEVLLGLSSGDRK